jgi:hypothetical protein
VNVKTPLGRLAFPRNAFPLYSHFSVVFDTPADKGAAPAGTQAEGEANPHLPADLDNLDARALAKLDSSLTTKALRLADIDDPSVEQVTELHHLADALDAIRDVSKSRADAIAERRAQRDELLNKIRPAEGTETTEGADAPPVAPVTGEEAPASGGKAGPAAKAGEPEEVAVPALAASGAQRRPVIGRITDIPQREIHTPASNEHHAVITAAGNLKDFSAGAELTWPEVAVAMARKADALASSRDAGAKHVVATVHYPAPPERTLLPRDDRGNAAKIEAVFGEDAIMNRLNAAGGKVSALVASGGLPGPFPADYTYEATAVADRPLQGCLGRFSVGNERGGVNYLQPPTLAGVSTGTGVWTHGTDATPGGTTKARVQINPPNAVSVTVDAITMSMEIGTFQRRFLPEEFEGSFGQIQAYHARLAEANILNEIAAASTTVYATQELGFARDIMTHLERLATGLRNRLRTNPQMPIQAVLPAWVRNAMRDDLIKEPDLTAPGLTAPADAEIEAFFDRAYLAPCWTYDSDTTISGTTRTVTDGVTTLNSNVVTSATAAFVNNDLGAVITSANLPAGTTIIAITSGTSVTVSANATAAGTAQSITIAFPSQLFPVQAAGPIQRWPAAAVCDLFVPGSMLFVDGGTYDLGIEIADSITTQQNNTITFAETFEATAFRGIEAYRAIIPVWVSGQASAALTLANSGSGS